MYWMKELSQGGQPPRRMNYGERGAGAESLVEKVRIAKEAIMDICEEVEQMESYGERRGMRNGYGNRMPENYGERRGYEGEYSIYQNDEYGQRRPMGGRY